MLSKSHFIFGWDNSTVYTSLVLRACVFVNVCLCARADVRTNSVPCCDWLSGEQCSTHWAASVSHDFAISLRAP